MRHRYPQFSSILTGVLVVCLLVSGAATAARKVKISFDAYHGYTGTMKYLHDVARQYPDITELLEIGKSNMDRSISVLVISNMKTGTTIDAHVTLRNMRKEGVQNVTPMKPYQGKPGHWISGSTHGNEYTGTEVCLYIIDKLVSGYGSDDQITKLVDSKTFYICPMINPDGVYNSVERGIPQRANSMKKDDDGDGRVNEDGPDDLNGDGKITRFRYKDPEGKYIIDTVDPRLMIRLGKDEATDKPRYSVITEDKDNDGDGKRGEDSEAGIDLNRNYPEGWFKDDGFAGGTGDFPTSAPESHAVVEFFTNHRNILMSQFYHTAGGFTYRPMGTAPHSSLDPRDVAVLDLVMGKKYLEVIGDEVPEAWRNPDSIPKLKEELEKTSRNKWAIQRGYELPRGWRVSYDEKQDRRYSYGMATDWAYKQYGIWSVTTELWNPGADVDEIPKFEGKDARVQQQRALLKYQDDTFGGKFFVPWKSYKHPELGDGEIGGWISQYRTNNALPGQPLVNVCEKHWQFELFRAGLMPEIVITDAKAKVLSTSSSGGGEVVRQNGDQVTIKKKGAAGSVKIVEVTAVIENKGPLATHLAKGATLPCLREDVVWLVGDREKVTFLQGTPFQKLGVLDGQMAIPGLKGKKGPDVPEQRSMQWMRRRRAPTVIRPLRQRQKSDAKKEKPSGPKRNVSWLVAVRDNAPLKIVVSSQKGGTVVKRLSVN